jgi:hypothetical protein
MIIFEGERSGISFKLEFTIVTNNRSAISMLQL